LQIKQFEEIEAWKEARHLTQMVYEITERNELKKDFGLTGQIQRAAVSIMSNIAEGFDSGSKAEFIRFLGYSRRSTSEVQCHLYVTLDQGYITREKFNMVYQQAEKTRKLVSAFIRYLRGTGQPANRPTG